jgi:hypothetical protein
MAKTGFDLPPELEARLKRFVGWGRKSKVMEGLLLVMLERAEAGDTSLLVEALRKYWFAHK